MAKYRKIDPRIWNDKKFRILSDKGKLVFIFLLTHPFMTAVGAMRGNVPGLAAELQWHEKDFREAFGEALAKGMVKHDEKASFVWVPKFIKYNRPESPNTLKAWGDALDLIPECDLYYQLLSHVKDYSEGLTVGFQKVLPDAFAKTRVILEQEQEQEIEDNTASEDAEEAEDIGEVLMTKKNRTLKKEKLVNFMSFWDAFAHKKGRAEAADAWLDVYSPQIFEKILAGARREAAQRPQTIKKGITPKMAQGWLSGRRWEDEGEVGQERGKKNCDTCKYKIVEKLNCWQERTQCNSHQPV